MMKMVNSSTKESQKKHDIFISKNPVGAGMLDRATSQEVLSVEECLRQQSYPQHFNNMTQHKLYQRVMLFLFRYPSLHKIHPRSLTLKFNYYVITAMIFVAVFLFPTFSFAQSQTGKASWYGNESICWQWGGHTRNGEMFDENKLTCAMPTKREINRWYKVTNLDTGKSVIVYANDTGSFKKYGRIIDLSKAAFDKIADLKTGVINVKVEGYHGKEKVKP